jgi:PAS domain S-box-containing protein
MPLPVVFLFVLGPREGLLWTGATLGALLLLLFVAPAAGVLERTPTWPAPDAVRDFVLACLTITLFVAVVDRLRREVLTRLEARLAAREADEARARDFAAIGTDLLFELDPELRITLLSSGWAPLTGLPTRRVIGRTVAEVVERARSIDGQLLAARLAGHETIHDETVDFDPGDGEVRTLMIRAVPRFAADGAFLGYRGVGVDQTERVRAQRALAAKERALQHAQRLEVVGQLTAGVAHDFNNLLTVILGNSELLRGQLEEAALPTAELEQIDSASRRAADLTSKLLSYARRQALQPEPVDLPELLLDTQHVLGRTLPPQIAVRMHADTTVPPCRADRGQLESALLNLALNARDAMPDGGELVFAARAVELDADAAARYDVAAGPWVLLRVRDTGTGMPEALLEHVFEPFFTTKALGTGLGLSMVQGFVMQSGGGIHVESTPGEGTTVELLLPRAP